MFSFRNIYRQYIQCRRNKRNTLNALRFEARQEENLLALREELVTRTYRPSRSVCFFAVRPKLREIFAADFRDRIVHHILVDHLEKIWEPIFIHDSYACRRGKGVHKGVLRLQQFIRQVTGNGTAPAWYLHIDIRNYFMSIDKEILFSLIAGKLRDEDALWLSRVLIFHDCTGNYIFRGDPGMLARIPPHKTLFGAPEGKGLPIGNLNSQFFANVYLNSLDQFVKHHLKCRQYLRYCDDFVLLSRSREELLTWKDQIEAYLRGRLALELNPHRQRLAPVSNGIDFLGYIVRGSYLLVRRRVVNNLRTRLRDYEARLVEERRHFRRYSFDERILDQLAASLSSYLGHLMMADTYNLRRSLRERHPFLLRYFGFDAETGRMVRTYKSPKGFWSAGQQYRYYWWRFSGDALLFQVGSFFELYHARDREIARCLGLAAMRSNARGARYGFPVALLPLYLRRLLERQRDVTVILEREHYLTRIKERTPAYRIERKTEMTGRRVL